jgi:hypothetical protein
MKGRAVVMGQTSASINHPKYVIRWTFEMTLVQYGIIKSQNDFLREWKELRAGYLDELLVLEQLPSEACRCGTAEGLLRCTDCFLSSVMCRECCLEAHRYLPFHRIQSWNGTYFKSSSLYAQGHIIYVGHGGQPCPNNHTPSFDTNKDVDSLVGAELNWEAEDSDMLWGQEDDMVDLEVAEDVMIIVHTTGVFQHRTRWCTCVGCPQRHMQLFRLGLFPCSSRRPRTVFTFDVLDYFHIDAMECKTAAQSFYNKIRRLTNNAFPHMVPVGGIVCVQPKFN